MTPVDIHLVSWNRPRMTELVIKTIHRNTKRDNFRLVVLDNGSEQSTVQMLQDMHDNGLIDQFIPIKTNLGLEAARQLLLTEATQGKYFVCVDNDCLPPPVNTLLSGDSNVPVDWLEKLINLMEKYEDYSAISLRTQVMIGSGDPFDGREDEEILDFPHPGGSYRLMRTGDVLAVGGWKRHEPLGGRGQEERLICGKLRAEGWRTGFATHIQCLHLFGNRDQTKERWGYDEAMRPEDSGHSDIYHPALEQGDQLEEVIKYTGDSLGHSYFNG